MYTHLLPPEMEIEHYYARRAERLRHADRLRPLRTSAQLVPPRLTDHLLLTAGDGLIALGQWLRQRSLASVSV